MRIFALIYPCLVFTAIADPIPDTDWNTYLGDVESRQHSALSQITKANVAQLEVAWEYRTGGRPGQIQCNPLVLDGVLYGISPSMHAFALDAATGEERWTTDLTEGRSGAGANRGFAQWTDPNGKRRLFVSVGRDLIALDPDTGELIRTFGDKGRVDLRRGLGVNPSNLWVTATTPGVVFDDLLVLGTRVSEGHPAAPGHIRAYDVRSGAIRWTFHTIPQPGEYGYATWPAGAYRRVGGANSWAGMSLDAERGLVFAPTGAAAYDFYGADRLGQNLFANCLLALDARTGERRWHFQTVHHDLWDRDLPAPPNLITIQRDGEAIDAVAQMTKNAYLFVFDRETGEPLFRIEETDSPPSDLPGETAWPTQPVPSKPQPFSRHAFTEEDITQRTTEAHAQALETWKSLRKGHPYEPPSAGGTLIFPGYDGGGEWGGAAFDPETGWLYVNASEIPWILTMIPLAPEQRARMQLPESFDDAPWFRSTGYNRFEDEEGYPAIAPPWGTLNAIDLSGGTIAWKVTLGHLPEAGYPGVERTGAENYGGPIVTAGGLIFIGATKDEKFRAFDKHSGALLWETALPFGAYATPATYAVDGKQYVVVAAGGGKMGTKPGDTYVAFTLPD